MEVYQIVAAAVVTLGLQYFTRKTLVVKGKAENLEKLSDKDKEVKANIAKGKPQKHPLMRLRHLPFKAHPDSKSTFTKEDLLIIN